MSKRTDLSHHLFYNFMNAKIEIKMTCMEKCFTPKFSTFQSGELKLEDQFCLTKCRERIYDFYNVVRDVYNENASAKMNK